MKKILAITGSPRPRANSHIMLEKFAEGAKKNGINVEIIDANKIDIDYCMGCLACNVKHQCINKKDVWPELSKKILEADVLVFASPVYFHHFPAPIKKILDRFRSFVHIKMTADGLIHTPYEEWKKDFVLLLSMGTVEDIDAQPILDLFDFFKREFGTENNVYVIKAKRVAVANQLTFDKKKLSILYKKLNLPLELIDNDYINNQKVLNDCQELGKKLSK